MLAVARLELLNDAPEDRRRAPRMQLALGAVVGDRGSSARIHNISTKGVLFETSASLADQLIQVKLLETFATQARIVWRDGRFFGCEFVEPISTATVSAAILKGEPCPHPTSNEPGSHHAGPHEARIRRPSLGPLLATLAAGLAVAAAAYLVESGNFVLLTVIAVIVAAIASGMLWLANWMLDNTCDF